MEEIKNKTKVDELEELLEKISIAIDMTRNKQNNIDKMTDELYNELKPMMVEKMKKEIEQAQNDKIEFDEMTKNALINAKKSILEIKEENEKAYQDKLLDTLKRKQEIDRKLSSMKNGKYPEEKIIIAETYANRNIEELNTEMEEFKKTHFELIEKLSKYEQDIWNSAAEIGVEMEIDLINLKEAEKEEKDKTEKDETEKAEKVEAEKVETVKAEKPEETKSETTKPEPVKPEPKKVEPVKPEKVEAEKEKKSDVRQDELTELTKRKEKIDRAIDEKIRLSVPKDLILKDVIDQFRDWIIDKYVYNESDPKKYSDSKTIPTREKIIEQLRQQSKETHPDKSLEDILAQYIGVHINDRIDLFKSNGYKQNLKVKPMEIEPRKTEPVKAEPRKTEPVKAEPRKTEPVKAEPKKVEPVKPEPRKNKPVNGTILRKEKLEITDIEINPFESTIQYCFNDKNTGRYCLSNKKFVPFDYRKKGIKDNIDVVDNLLDRDDIHYLSKAIDPNILKWLAENNYNLQIEDYLDILGGYKDDVNITYNLRDIYNSDLDSKQIKNVIKIAKHAEWLSDGAVQVERDSLFRRFYGNIKKKLDDSHIKRLYSRKEEEKYIGKTKNKNNNFIPKASVDEKAAIKECSEKETSRDDIYDIPVYYLPSSDDRNER